jgi:hypothetical protein
MQKTILVHKGYSWYLPITFSNAKKICGGNLYFIGDSFSCMIARLFGIESFPIHEYSNDSELFAKIYIHYSSLGEDFELFCIQRWFILAEFLNKQKLNSCLYTDTDVLIIRHLDKEQKACLAYELTYTGTSAHVCFINGREALTRFCQFVRDTYIDPKSVFKMNQYFLKKIEDNAGGGVSDMTLFQWYQKEHPDRLGSYSEIFEDSPFDETLDECDGFKRDKDGFKLLEWKNNQPNAYLLNGRKIPLATLHHQGRAKSIIKENANKVGVGLIITSVASPMFFFLYRIIRKLKNINKNK